MKLIDNIDYKLIIENYKKDISNLENSIKKRKYYIIFKVLFILLGGVIIAWSINNIDLQSSEIAPEDIGWLFLLIFGFIFSICFLLFTVFSIDELKYDKKRYKKATNILEINESIKEKALNISKEHIFYQPHSIYDFTNRVDFIVKDCKILKIQYYIKNSNLHVRYVENNEIKDKNFYCEIHYFEKLKEPELVLTNEKILLNIEYEEEMDFEKINII